jgi:hypothetical protein
MSTHSPLSQSAPVVHAVKLHTRSTHSQPPSTFTTSAHAPPSPQSVVMPAAQLSAGSPVGQIVISMHSPVNSSQTAPSGQQVKPVGPNGPNCAQTRLKSPRHCLQACVQAAFCGPGRPAQPTAQALGAALAPRRVSAAPAAAIPPAKVRITPRRETLVASFLDNSSKR